MNLREETEFLLKNNGLKANKNCDNSVRTSAMKMTSFQVHLGRNEAKAEVENIESTGGWLRDLPSHVDFL